MVCVCVCTMSGNVCERKCVRGKRYQWFSGVFLISFCILSLFSPRHLFFYHHSCLACQMLQPAVNSTGPRTGKIITAQISNDAPLHSTSTQYSISPVSPLLHLFLLPPPILPSILFLDLEDEEAQVDVFGSQQFVALHRVGDGQGDVLRLVGVVAEGVMVDDGLDPDVVVRPLQQQEGTLQSRVHLSRTDTTQRSRQQNK